MANTDARGEAAAADAARRRAMTEEDFRVLKDRSDWNTGLIRFSYDQVLDATKHQDDKIGRLLTAVAFLTAASLALAGLDSARLISTQVVIEDDLSLPLGVWFFAIFLIAVIVVVIQLIGSLSTPLRLPGLNPSRKGLRDGSGASTIYFNEIERMPLEAWRSRWEAESLSRFDFIDNRRKHLINETHNLAVRTAFKYNRTTEAIAVFTWALTALACAVAVALIVARNRAFGSADTAWKCVASTTTTTTTAAKPPVTSVATASTSPSGFEGCQLTLSRADFLILAAVVAVSVLTFALARLRYDAPGVDDRRPFGQAWMQRTFVLVAFVSTLTLVGWTPILGGASATLVGLTIFLSAALLSALVFASFNAFVADRGDRWAHDAPQQGLAVPSLLYLPIAAILIMICISRWPDSGSAAGGDWGSAIWVFACWAALSLGYLVGIETGLLRVRVAIENRAEADDSRHDHWASLHKVMTQTLRWSAWALLAVSIVAITWLAKNAASALTAAIVLAVFSGVCSLLVFVQVAGIPSALRGMKADEAEVPLEEPSHHVGSSDACRRCSFHRHRRVRRNLLSRVLAYMVVVAGLGLLATWGMSTGAGAAVLGAAFTGLTALFASSALEPTFRARDARFQADLAVAHNEQPQEPETGQLALLPAPTT